MLKKALCGLSVFFVLSSGAFASVVNIDVVANLYNPKSQQEIRDIILIEKRMGSKINFNVVPFVVEKDKEITSPFGPMDLKEAKRIAVVKRDFPEELSDYLLSLFLGNTWQDSAAFAGISPKKLKSLEVKKGEEYLNQEVRFLKEKNISQSGPSIYINGKPYAGESQAVALLSEINKNLDKKDRINIPADRVQFNLYIVESEKYPQGKENAQLTLGLAQFVGLESNVKKLNLKEAQKRADFKNINIDFLPLYLIEKSEDTTALFDPYIKQGMAAENDNYIILARQTPYGVLANRAEKENLLEVFVMSQCPYGVMAENAIIASMNDGNFPKDVKVRIRYIASTVGKDGFNSLHGPAEWQEDARQLVIQEDYPEKFYKYLYYRNKDYRKADWKEAAEKAGINPAKIEKNFEKGKKLLRDDIEYTQELGVGASPTFLWEGKVLTDMNGLRSFSKFKKFNPGASPTSEPMGSCN